MKVRFWGVRGSIPTPEMDKMQVGGNTSCIELTAAGKRVIFDMGTGVIPLGKQIAREIATGQTKEVIIVLSHTHWDHIQGFPFFVPIYMNNVKITIFGPAKANRQLEAVMGGQMEYDYFPVKFSHLPANLNFVELNEGFHRIADGITLAAKRHIHPGVAFGYRVEADHKVMCYSTDTEHFQNVLDKRVVELAEGADLLVHDSQYTDEEIGYKLGWGHSTWRQSLEVANTAKVKKLVLFHADPDRTDTAASEIEKQAQVIRPDTVLAREGHEITL